MRNVFCNQWGNIKKLVLKRFLLTLKIYITFGYGIHAAKDKKYISLDFRRHLLEFILQKSFPEIFLNFARKAPVKESFIAFA